MSHVLDLLANGSPSSVSGCFSRSSEAYLYIIFTANHERMVSKFESVMSRLATVGQVSASGICMTIAIQKYPQNPRSLVDCSEVIPVPKTVKLPAPTLPAGKTVSDIQAAVCVDLSRCDQYLIFFVETLSARLPLSRGFKRPLVSFRVIHWLLFVLISVVRIIQVRRRPFPQCEYKPSQFHPFLF